MPNPCRKSFSQFEYRNWDILIFRRLWATDPNRIQESFDFSNPRLSRLLILDEIHKSKGWRKDRHDKLIREDLRDLSRIPELSQVEMLTALLPDKVGSLHSEIVEKRGKNLFV